MLGGNRLAVRGGSAAHQRDVEWRFTKSSIAVVSARASLRNRNDVSATVFQRRRQFPLTTTLGYFGRCRAGNWDRSRGCQAPYSGSSHWDRKKRNKRAPTSPAGPAQALQARSTRSSPRQKI